MITAKDFADCPVFANWFSPVKTSKYLGIDNTIYVYRGAWSDPQLFYKNVELGYFNVEDGLYNMMREDIAEGLYPEDIEFADWVHENEESVISMLEDMYWNVTANKEE